MWIRNLGRDDRAISDNGKECRYPFLDEIVVSEIAKINFKALTNFDLPKGGGGEKLLLRKVAKKLGLKYIFKIFNQNLKKYFFFFLKYGNFKTPYFFPPIANKKKKFKFFFS